MHIEKLLFLPLVFTSACLLALTSKIGFSFNRLYLYALLTKNFPTRSQKFCQKVVTMVS